MFRGSRLRGIRTLVAGSASKFRVWGSEFRLRGLCLGHLGGLGLGV